MNPQPTVIYASQPAPRMNPILAAVIGIAIAIAAQWFGIPLPSVPHPQTPPAPIQPGQPPFGLPQPPSPPPIAVPPTPPAPQPPKADPLAAIGRIQFGSAGCTATITGPRREDGRYWVLTAAHCISGVGQQGTMKLRDGRSLGLQVAAVDKRADCCWCVTTTNSVEYPVAFVADRSPAAGSRIWHAGYGVDVPGNREDGTVTAGPNGDGQIEMRLSVSSGDSGGGIALDADGRIVSCVCCTTAKGQVARVWGASPESINKLRPATVSLDVWTPIEIPVIMPPAE